MTAEATRFLCAVVRHHADKILNPQVVHDSSRFQSDRPVLVILAAGKGSRFGTAPKCAQSVCGIPLGRHSIEAFRSISGSPAVCIVGYSDDGAGNG